jgi:hypothetical protein
MVDSDASGHRSAFCWRSWRCSSVADAEPRQAGIQTSDLHRVSRTALAGQPRLLIDQFLLGRHVQHLIGMVLQRPTELAIPKRRSLRGGPDGCDCR